MNDKSAVEQCQRVKKSAVVVSYVHKYKTSHLSVHYISHNIHHHFFLPLATIRGTIHVNCISNTNPRMARLIMMASLFNVFALRVAAAAAS